jgi:pilus assembly protein CpaB
MKAVSPGTLILGIFAVLFGLVGAYAAKQYLSAPPAAVAQKPKSMIVPMAAANLVPGRTLTVGDVMLVSLTPDEIQRRRLPPLFLTNPRQVIGRTLRESLAKGDAFTTTCLYPEGMGPSVTERLKPGYRAATIPLENSASELSVVTPGTTVDIVFRTNREAVKNMPETTVNLLENVEVLAVGSETFQGARPVGTNGANSAKTTVTLAVSPQQVSALKVVEGRGTMSLVARNPQDKGSNGPSEPQTLANLLRVADPKPFTTEIYRRGSLTTVTFDNGQRSATRQDADGFPIAAGFPSPTSMASDTRTPVVPVSQTVAKGADGQAADGSAKTCTSCQARKSH